MRIKFKVPGLFRTLVIAFCATSCQSSLAVGMGSIEIASHLNENFIATIEINDTDYLDLENSGVRLAKIKDFDRAGIPFSSTLLKLKFAIETNPSLNPYIRVWSDDPIRDPYLQFIVELTLQESSIAKEFTVLIDPAGFFENGSSSSRSRRQEELEITIGPINRKDTLWPIAKKNRPNQEVSVEQMMVAIVKKNPAAFGRGNINILLEGSTLIIPSIEEIKKISQLDAMNEVRRQTKQWTDRKKVSEIPVEGVISIETGARLELLAPDTGSSSELKVSALLKEEATVQAIQNAELEARLKESEEIISLLREQTNSQRKEIGAMKARIESMEPKITPSQTTSNQRDEVAYLWWMVIGVSVAFLGALLFFRNRTSEAMVSIEGLAIARERGSESISDRGEGEFTGINPTEISETSIAERETSSGGDRKDPLAGLNVYLAYERYEEAKEIVRRAIVDNPHELSYRLKLLEVLAATNSIIEFKEEALFVKKLVGTEGADWKNVVALYEKLDDKIGLNLDDPKKVGADSAEQANVVDDYSEPTVEAFDSDTGDDSPTDVKGSDELDLNNSFEVDLDIDEKFSDSTDPDESILSITPVDEKND